MRIVHNLLGRGAVPRPSGQHRARYWRTLAAQPLGLLLLYVCLGLPGALAAPTWTGNAAIEGRVFPHQGDAEQQDENLSVSALVEYYRAWDDNRQSLLFSPFIRLDQHDEERSHFDIRELTWLKVADDWELRVGIRKVFWGVTESQHLVDIINQTDTVENIDGEDKLGQPMINLALIKDWGTLDLFLLTGFRERTFPGEEGRLRTPLLVDNDEAVYEAGNDEKHTDVALRWVRTLGDWDLGLSHFYGTSREPRLQFIPQISTDKLIPVYDLIHQSGVDLQLVADAWLWKFEGIHRSGQGHTFNAATAGFEYTFVGIRDSAVDLGLVVEYLYDDRGQRATTPFEDDILIAGRLTLNDAQSTEMLFGTIQDLEGDGHSFIVEASRRLSDAWKLNLEVRTFSSDERADPSYFLRNDDHLQLELARYF